MDGIMFTKEKKMLVKLVIQSHLLVIKFKLKKIFLVHLSSETCPYYFTISYYKIEVEH